MRRRYDYRRKLPHLQPDFKAFFITFSTHRRWVLPETVRQIVIDTCLAGNGGKFRLYAVVVMPDHVHLVLQPKYDGAGPFSIPEIMQAIKGGSAHRINRAIGRKGKVWEEESFDRALRKEESIGQKIEYILGNPVSEGLVENPLEYRWLWRDAGGIEADGGRASRPSENET